MVSMEIFVDLILPGALVHWGDSASNRNWYQVYFLGGKDGRDVGLTTVSLLHADCLKIWEQNLLESPGPVQSRMVITLLFAKCY